MPNGTAKELRVYAVWWPPSPLSPKVPSLSFGLFLSSVDSIVCHVFDEAFTAIAKRIARTGLDYLMGREPMSNNTATGRHRRLHRSLGVTTFLGTVTVASIVASGVAVAAPGQAGLAPDGDQPGLSDGQSAQAGLPETAAPAPAPAEAWVPVPEQYSQPTAPLPNWDYEANQPTSYEPTYTPPIDYSQLQPSSRIIVVDAQRSSIWAT